MKWCIFKNSMCNIYMLEISRLKKTLVIVCIIYTHIYTWIYTCMYVIYMLKMKWYFFNLWNPEKVLLIYMYVYVCVCVCCGSQHYIVRFNWQSLGWPTGITYSIGENPTCKALGIFAFGRVAVISIKPLWDRVLTFPRWDSSQIPLAVY